MTMNNNNIIIGQQNSLRVRPFPFAILYRQMNDIKTKQKKVSL